MGMTGKAYLVENHFKKKCRSKTEGQWGERTAIKIYRRNISEEVFITVQGRERGSLTRTVPVRLERREWVGEH